ncbi:MAG TPA: c-type cytochrome biogenesis protein CcmI [Verrucomicrobiae bacterium]|nr:c-type cytochrome biogenesis protein CcmI [Verrucomicrobiae bacterium]
MTWLIGALVTLAAIAALALPWWWPRFADRPGLKRRAANVAAYRGRLQEVEADVAGGILNADTLQAARDELAARLVQDADLVEPALEQAARSSMPLVMASVALLAFATAWYGFAGSWRTQALVELSRTDPDAARAQAVDQMIAKLRAQLADSPDDADAWAWLGRSLAGRGSWPEAAEAFGRASNLKSGQDPDLLVEEGEALAYSQERRMEGEPAKRFAAALTIAPEHSKALWYAGISAAQAGEDRAAIALWERLAAQPLGNDMQTALQHALAQLRERAGVPAPVAKAKSPAATGATALRVEVSVAPELAAEASPEAVLFVFAQDPAGPPMPLAVERRAAGPWPVQATLDDEDAMTPTRKMSSVSRWRVVARISRAGSATPQPGDLEGSVEVERSDASKTVRVLIDRRRS